MPQGGRALQGTETSSRASPRLEPGQGGGARPGTRAARLTALWGAEGHLAGGSWAPAIKSLHLQTIGAVGPKASQDGAGGVGRHHHVAFVDMPLAVLLLTALPPVCHLQMDKGPHRGRSHPAVIPGHMLPTALNKNPFLSTQGLPEEQRAGDRGLHPILSLLVSSRLTLGTAPPSFYTLDPYIISAEVTLDLGWVQGPPLDQHSA